MKYQKKGTPQFKKVSVQEKDDIMRKLVSILRTKDLSEEEEEVIENAEVATADYESIKSEVYNAKSVETLTGLVKKYQIVPESFLAQYISRRTVWLRAFEYKNNKTTKDAVVKLLNRYKSSFREIDYNKVIAFINFDNYGKK